MYKFACLLGCDMSVVQECDLDKGSEDMSCDCSCCSLVTFMSLQDMLQVEA